MTPTVKRAVLIFAGILGAIAVVIVVAVLLTRPNQLEAAADECETASTPLTAGDDGQSLALTAKTAEEFEVADCVFDELAVPDSIRSKMGQTTALQGRQTDSWDDLDVSWSFHPDNGLDVVFEAD